MRNYIKVMKALADPSRVRILKLLQQRELCVCELNELFDLSQPTISKHLKVLEVAELVTFRKEGNWVVYRANDTRASGHAQAMLGYLDQARLDDDALREMLRHLPSIDRELIKTIGKKTTIKEHNTGDQSTRPRLCEM